MNTNNEITNKFSNIPNVEQEEITKVHDYNEESYISPFKILQKNNEFTIILGNQIVSNKKFTHLCFAEDYVKSKPYELIIALIGLTYEMQEQYKQDQKQLKEFKNETSS